MVGWGRRALPLTTAGKSDLVPSQREQRHSPGADHQSDPGPLPSIVGQGPEGNAIDDGGGNHHGCKREQVIATGGV